MFSWKTVKKDKIKLMEEREGFTIEIDKPLENDNTDSNTAQELDEELIYSGYFKDRSKRIDVVLVVKDDGDQEVEKIKINYLMSAIKVGLELEIDTGMMPAHKNLIFIKVHGPESVLKEYATYFHMKRYFKDSHVEFVTSYRTPLEYIFPFIRLKHEREWIKLARKYYKPSYFSNIERSLIVHRILLQLKFGDHANNIGLQRLLRRNIILDAYALHDGPYFFLPNQNLQTINARQLLFYNWTGTTNLYKLQPFDLIHEYFGERVSFYFAFFGYYNQALSMAAAVGLIIQFLEVLDSSDRIINQETCNDVDTVICPTCRRFDVCPFKKLSDYCIMMQIINIIDNPYTFYYCLFVALWAIMVLAFWKRKENYWMWMWELNYKDINSIIRPEFRINYNTVGRSTVTGIMKNFESRRRRVFRIALTTVILVLSVATVLMVNVTLIIFKYWFMLALSSSFRQDWGEYIVLGLFSVINVVIIIALELACKQLSYLLNDFENHRTQGSYERSLVFKLYGFTFAFTFAMFIFFAYIKGVLYTYPSDPSRWYSLFGLGMLSCSPLGCLDEVWVMLMVSLFAKQVFIRITLQIFKFKTDYSGDAINSKYPCWEREYRLKPATEELISDKFKDLVTQFGLVTLFVAAFPLAPLFALIVNIWDVRHHGRLFLLCCRRPLLSRCSGLGAWRDVLVILAYATALTNALTLAMTTKTIQRHIYLLDHDSMHGFLNWTLSIFDVQDYLGEAGSDSPAEAFLNYKGFKPKQYCFYPGFRKPPSGPDRYKREEDYWYIKFYETLFILMFEHCVICLVLIVHYLIPPTATDVRDTVAIEQRLKNMYAKKNVQPELN